MSLKAKKSKSHLPCTSATSAFIHVIFFVTFPLCTEHLLRTSSTSRPASLPRVPAMESAKTISGNDFYPKNY